MIQWLSVVQVLHLVDPDQPVLRRERLLQVLELNVLVSDLGVARPVEARRRSEVQLGEGRGCHTTRSLMASCCCCVSASVEYLKV